MLLLLLPIRGCLSPRTAAAPAGSESEGGLLIVRGRAALGVGLLRVLGVLQATPDGDQRLANRFPAGLSSVEARDSRREMNRNAGGRPCCGVVLRGLALAARRAVAVASGPSCRNGAFPLRWPEANQAPSMHGRLGVRYLRAALASRTRLRGVGTRCLASRDGQESSTGGGGSARWHPGAVVDSAATVHASVCLGPFSVILGGVTVEEGAVIEAHCVIGPDVVVGREAVIKSHVSLSHCTLANNVVVWSGVRVGQDGFGFHPAPSPAVASCEAGSTDVTKKKQEWRVVIGAHVEVGANCTIDRGSWRDTTLG